MSHAGPAVGFPHSDATARPNQNGKTTRMKHDADLPLEDLKRLPGLYRRWELTEVFEPHRNYQIEDAGTHADGTPLLAIYVSDPMADAIPEAFPGTKRSGVWVTLIIASGCLFFLYNNLLERVPNFKLE